MGTEIKNRKILQELLTPLAEKRAGVCFEDELIGYNFLRNIWGTYFFDRQEISSEDKIDQINKIVGMMKAQIKLRITHEANFIDRQIYTHSSSEGSNDSFNFLLMEHEKTKESLERSKMREEELYTKLLAKEIAVSSLEKQNSDLKLQLFELKQSKNQSEQKIIELSSRVYELERGYFLNTSMECIQQDEANNTLDQFSAISIDHDEEKEKPRASLFCKRENISFDLNALNDDVHSERDASQRLQFCELNLNLPLRSRNPMKQSLQFYDKDASKNPTHFIEEMKRMKLKTDRIVEIENDRISHRQNRRKTFASTSQILSPDVIHQETERRRFRRIRC